jgi:hypothetical protein
MKYGEIIPDAELLGDTLQSLWKDNKPRKSSWKFMIA